MSRDKKFKGVVHRVDGGREGRLVPGPGQWQRFIGNMPDDHFQSSQPDRKHYVRAPAENRNHYLLLTNQKTHSLPLRPKKRI